MVQTPVGPIAHSGKLILQFPDLPQDCRVSLRRDVWHENPRVEWGQMLRLLPRPFEPLRQRRGALGPLLNWPSRRRVADRLGAILLPVGQGPAGAGGGLQFVVGEPGYGSHSVARVRVGPTSG